MEIDLSLVEMYCDEAADLLSRWETIGLDLSKAENSSLYPELFRIAHNLKGGSRAVGLSSFGDFVHKVEDGITLLRDGKIRLNSNIVHLVLESQKILSDWLQVVKTDPTFNKDVSNFIANFDIAFFGKAQEESTATQAVTINEEFEEINHKKVIIDKKKVVSQNETIRIPASKLDELIQVIGELSIHQSIVWHTRGVGFAHNKMFMNSLQLGQKLTKELYDKALSLRMQPIQSVFQRLERNIVDLSRDMNKDVIVDIEGGDVELDKSVIERILDPLTHIVRNAIDHGIESSGLRTESGKASKGHILIAAKQDTFGVELLIKDDGKGLSADKILKKAKEKGLISESANPSRNEIFDLIFLPGFSTAEKVTDVSGRGVGMDVVRRTLEELRGNVQIESQEGVGTEFRITLPTSVSIIDAMLIVVSGQNYVVPVGAIEEVIYLDKAVSASMNMIEHNNQVLPIQDLEVVLSGRRGHRAKSLKTEFKTILVCKHQNKKVGLVIDCVMGQQQVVIRPLNENIDGAFGLMGGTILGNGEPGLIIDIPALNEYFLNETQTMEKVS